MYEKNIKDYDKICKIGKGAFSIVYKIEYNGNFYAAKTFFKNDGTTEEDQWDQIRISREIEILTKFNHPTIITFHGYSLIDFDNEKNITLIMDWAANGSLYMYLEKVRKSSENKYELNNTNRQIILIGIARGMMFLHQNGIIHRDLKPENILLDEHLRPHITDFNLSKRVDPSDPNNQSLHDSTELYMSPEMIGKEDYDFKTDVYSFSLVMYEIVTNEIPKFPGDKTINNSINAALNGSRPSIPSSVKPAFRDLICRCWAQDPQNRPDFEQIYKMLAFGMAHNGEEFSSDTYDYYLDDTDLDKIFDYVKIVDDCRMVYDKVLLSEKEKKNMKNRIKILEDKIDDVSRKQEEQINNTLKQFKEMLEETKKEIADLKNENAQLKKSLEKEKEEEKVKVKVKEKEIVKEKEKEEVKEKEKEKEKKSVDIKTPIIQVKQGQDVSKSLNKVTETRFRRNSTLSFTRSQPQIQTRQLSVGEPKSLEETIAEIELSCGSDPYIFKKATIECFNRLSGFAQSKVFATFLRKIHDDNNKNAVQKVTQLLRFISQMEDPKKINNSNYIEIHLDLFEDQTQINNSSFIPNLEEKINILDSIYFSSYSTELFYSKGQLNKDSNLYKDYLINFNEIFIEVRYPSESFSDIYTTVLKLRDELSKERRILLSISFSNIDETGDKFKKDANINYIKIDSSVQSISCRAFFELNELIGVSISDNLKTIGRGAFSGCKKLKELRFPSSLNEIDEDVLSSCTSLKKVTIQDNVKEIGNSAFFECTSLESVKLPQSLTKIGEYAFNQCSSLKEVILPPNINSIESKAFLKCTSLKLVKHPHNFKCTKKDAFPENTNFESY